MSLGSDLDTERALVDILHVYGRSVFYVLFILILFLLCFNDSMFFLVLNLVTSALSYSLRQRLLVNALLILNFSLNLGDDDCCSSRFLLLFLSLVSFSSSIFYISAFVHCTATCLKRCVVIIFRFH